MVNIKADTSVNAFYSGVAALQNGENALSDVGSQLANAHSKPVDLNKAAVSLLSNEVQAEAAIEIIKRADGMVGTIIDTFA